MKIYNENIYSIMKWVTVLLIPALSALYVGLAGIWGFPYAEQISQTANVVVAFLGAVLAIDAVGYKKEA